MSEPFAMPARSDAPVDDRAEPTFLQPDPLAVERPSVSAFVPLLLLGLVLLAWFGYQATVAMADRDVIRIATAGQDRQVDESRKLRAAFETLYRGARQLADGGNDNARLVVDELKKRGVGLDGAAPPAAPAK